MNTHVLQAQPVLRKAKSDSAVAQHLKETTACLQGGDDVRKRFQVLARAKHPSHLSLLEAVHIRDKTPDMCKQKGLCSCVAPGLDSLVFASQRLCECVPVDLTKCIVPQNCPHLSLHVS